MKTSNLSLYLQATLLAGLVLVALSIPVYTVMTGVPPMPTSRRVRKLMFSLIPPEFRGTIMDLGCGWGNLIFPLAKQNPECRVVGCELSPAPWLFCRIRQLGGSYPNLRLFRGDFWKVSCKDASLLICYLDPSLMKALEEKLAAELLPNALVIMNTFALPSWKPESIYQVDDLHRTRIYMYRVPSD